MSSMLETGGHRTILRVERFDAGQVRWAASKSGLAEPSGDQLQRWMTPYEVTEAEGNLVTDAGWNLLMKNAASASPGTVFSATVGRIGVGDGVTAVGYTDTDLSAASGSTHRQFKLISATPTVGSTHSAGLVFAATFGTAQANFHWQEFGTDQGTADGTTVTAVLFNHGLSDQGTKLSGQVWVATETITWL